MAINTFGFKKHNSRDSDKTLVLDHAKSLRDLSTKFGQASRVLGIRGLRLSKNDYYNLARSEGKHTPQKNLQFALAFLNKKRFHVRILENHLVEQNIRQKRVIDYFFFFFL